MSKGIDLGTALKKVRNKYLVEQLRQEDAYGSNDINPVYSGQMLLLGDPTFNLNLNQPQTIKKSIIDISEDYSVITLNIPRLERIYFPIEAEEFCTSYSHNYQFFEIPYGDHVWSHHILYLEQEPNTYNDCYQGGDYPRIITSNFGSYIWYVDLPEDKKINSIGKIEFLKEGILNLITNSDVTVFYPSSVWCSQGGKRIFFSKDDTKDNRYWFVLFECLGGDPPLAMDQEISEYEYKIYLEVE